MPGGRGIEYYLGLDTGGFTGGAGAALGQVDALKSGLQGLMGMAVIGGGMTIIGESLRKAMNFELQTAQLKVLTGSVSSAKALMDEVQNFTATTPLRDEETMASTRALMAFGFAAGEVIPNLRMLGDIATATGMPLRELAEIYGKARVQGRLFGEDINQLTGRGIPVTQALADVMKVSADQVRGLVEAGQIGFPQLAQAMAAMTGEGGKFKGMMEEMGKTTSAQIDTLKDKVDQLWRKLGEKMLPAQAFGLKATNFFMDPQTWKDMAESLDDMMWKGGSKPLVERMAEKAMNREQAERRRQAGKASADQREKEAAAEAEKIKDPSLLGITILGHVNTPSAEDASPYRAPLADFGVMHWMGGGMKLGLGKQAPEAPALEQMLARTPMADRLARIGGFVGAVSGRGTDRTAENTEQWTKRTALAAETLARQGRNQGGTTF